MFTRRSVLKGLTALAATGTGVAGYAFGLEPLWRLNVQRYALTPHRWPLGLNLRIAVVADLHAGEPQMPVHRIEQIVHTTNNLGADLIVLLGDFEAGHRWQSRIVPPAKWAGALAALKAPLGVHSVLGNHDWWDDHAAQRRGKGPVYGRLALERAGIAVYENDVIRLRKDTQDFWLAGLADQLAFRKGRVNGRWVFQGIDDLDGTLAKANDQSPVILLAHEPDIFARVPDRVSVTLSGHTHGGQVRLFGYSPIVPSRYGNRYAYGHIVEHGRNLIVSGGLGCSILPVRFGVPPEIVVVDLAGQQLDAPRTA